MLCCQSLLLSILRALALCLYLTQSLYLPPSLVFTLFAFFFHSLSLSSYSLSPASLGLVVFHFPTWPVNDFPATLLALWLSQPVKLVHTVWHTDTYRYTHVSRGEEWGKEGPQPPSDSVGLFPTHTKICVNNVARDSNHHHQHCNTFLFWSSLYTWKHGYCYVNHNDGSDAFM